MYHTRMVQNSYIASYGLVRIWWPNNTELCVGIFVTVVQEKLLQFIVARPGRLHVFKHCVFGSSL